MIKTVFATVFVLLMSGLTIYGQQNATSPSYERNSITLMFVDSRGMNHWSQVKEKISSLDLSDKYDNHNLQQMLIQPSFGRSNVGATQLLNKYKDEIDKTNTCRNILSKWYNRKEDGTMDMELMHSRGRFSATDADFLIASSTQRGEAALKDLGNRLVNRSYILLVDFTEIKSMAEVGSDELEGYRANVSGYLYRLDLDDETRNAFYDCWIYEDDSPEVRAGKLRAYEKLKVPLVGVKSVSASVTSSQTKKYGSKTDDQLIEQLAQKSYDELLYNLEMEVDEFKVTTSLYARRPLQAKIGRKEGLQTDNRFYVYEHVLNARTNQIRQVRRGVIRAGSQSQIHDNRHEAFGDMGTSTFYQVGGRRLHEGYTLMQRNDHGIEILLGAEVGGIGGGYGRLDLRTGRFTGIKAFFIYVDAGLDGGNAVIEEEETFTFLRLGAGLAKGFHLTRNTEFRPYLGLGVENASSENFKEDDALQAYYMKGGANLALNLTHNFQLLAGAGSYWFVTNAENKSETAPDVQWDTLFENRSGLSLVFGIKFMF